MEIKMMEAHTKHREEASELSDKLKKVTVALENVKDERSNLLEMNTALSGQVKNLFFVSFMFLLMHTLFLCL